MRSQQGRQAGRIRSNPRGNRELSRAESSGKNGHDVHESLEKWGSYLAAGRGRAPGTIRRYQQILTRFLSWERITTFEAITLAAAERHLRALSTGGAGASVRQGFVVAVRSWCEYLLSHRVFSESPVVHLHGPATYRDEVRPLTVAEVKRLLFDQVPGDHRQLRNRTLLAVAYIAGLRADELGRLRLVDTEWNDAAKTFSILVRHAKSSRQDHRLYLDTSVSRLLGLYLSVRERQERAASSPWVFLSSRGTPLSRAAVYRIFLDRIAECGIEAQGRRLSPHILRHSIATHLLEEGVEIDKVQFHLRHKSIATTMLYVHTVNRRRLPGVLASRSPLREGKRKRPVAPAVRQLLGELAGLHSTKEPF